MQRVPTHQRIRPDTRALLGRMARDTGERINDLIHVAVLLLARKMGRAAK